MGAATALAAGVRLTLNGGALDLNGNDLTVSFLAGTAGGLTDKSATPGVTTLTVNQTASTVYSGSLTDGPARTLALTKTGTGTLTLSGANTFSGALNLRAGTLLVAGPDGTTPLNGPVNMGDGSAAVSLIVGATGRQFGPNTVFNFTDEALNAKLILRGSTQTVGGFDSTANPNFALSIIENDETGSAGFTVAPGLATLIINAAANHSFAGLIRNQIGGGLNLVKEGVGTQEIRNILVTSDSFGAVTINNGKLSFNLSTNANGTNNVGTLSSFLINSGGTLGLDGNWALNRPIAGTGTLFKQGTGTVTLNGTSTFSGTTVLSEGTLVSTFAAGNGLGGNVTLGTGTQSGIFLVMGALNQFAPTSVLTFNNGPARDAKFELRGFSQTVGGLQSDADDTLSIIQNQETGAPASATLTINAQSDYIFNGLIRTQIGGQLNLVKMGPGTQELRNVPAQAYNFGAATINEGRLTFNLSGVNNTIGLNTSFLINTPGVLGLDGEFPMTRPTSGTGSVLKTGPGTVTVSGAFSHTGDTRISSGTLLVTGSIAGNVSVDGATAILAGNGFVGGFVAKNGGSVAPGLLGSAGTLSTTSNVALQSGTTLNVDVNFNSPGFGYDQLNVSGTVDVTGATLALGGSYFFPDAAGTDIFYVILNDGSDAVVGNFQGLAEGSHVFSPLGQDFVLTYLADSFSNSTVGGNDIALIAVPEPRGLALLLAGLGTMVGLGRIRRPARAPQITRPQVFAHHGSECLARSALECCGAPQLYTGRARRQGA